MLNEFGVFLTIVGTILGCGFFSGKEIVIFFSQFGQWSYLAIFLAFIFFFLIFKFLLNVSTLALKKIQSSKLFLIFNIANCIIFSAVMFACIRECFEISFVFQILILAIVVCLCVFILKNGFSVFSNFNKIFVPFMCLLFIVLLFNKFSFSFQANFLTSLPFPSIFYSLLYCALNGANNCLVISKLGQNLHSKQKTRIAFLSAFVLSIILLCANFTLLQNQDSFNSIMPFLSIFYGWQNLALKIVIFLGALTSLCSLTFNFRISLENVITNKLLLYFIAIVIPLIVSLFGFSFIVSFLEPIASVFSINVLIFFLITNSFVTKKSLKILKN